MAPHWTGLIVIGILLLLLFGGRGKISSLMGDFAKGITAFRKGLKDDDASGKAEAEKQDAPLKREALSGERSAPSEAPTASGAASKDERAGS